MFKKRGFTQVDWAMSLAIFLMYLAWFFVIVKPQVVDTQILSPNYVELKSEFIEKSSSKVSLIPLIISSEDIIENEILEIDLSFLEYDDYGILTDNPYYIEDDNLFILKSINSSKTIDYIVVCENQTYEDISFQDQGIYINNGSINTNGNISIEYSYGIDSILNNGIERIDNIRYYQNDERLDPNISVDNKGLILELEEEFQPYSVRYDVRSGKDYIRGKYRKDENFEDFNTTITLDVKDYEDYFITNLNQGNLSDGDCDSESSKYIKFQNDNETLIFLFNKYVNISLCKDDEDYELELNFLDNNLNFEISFSDKEDLEFGYDYQYIFGVDNTNELMLDSKISMVNESMISFDDYNFQVIVFNTSIDDTDIKKDSIFNIIGEFPEDTNREVFSHDEIVNVQDKYGNIRRMILNVKIWE
ncbi:hypothetical protein C0585_04510 [Candidatus Woesearchaeota archaeon]|nr:MAG: hypothetical protein C0585_04510 [Candidatus Woesearchaeota archaeon]